MRVWWRCKCLIVYLIWVFQMGLSDQICWIAIIRTTTWMIQWTAYCLRKTMKCQWAGYNRTPLWSNCEASHLPPPLSWNIIFGCQAKRAYLSLKFGACNDFLWSFFMIPIKTLVLLRLNELDLEKIRNGLAHKKISIYEWSSGWVGLGILENMEFQ